MKNVLERRLPLIMLLKPRWVIWKPPVRPFSLCYMGMHASANFQQHRHASPREGQVACSLFHLRIEMTFSLCFFVNFLIHLRAHVSSLVLCPSFPKQISPLFKIVVLLITQVFVKELSCDLLGFRSEPQFLHKAPG